MREAIEELKRAGVAVMSSSSARGYRLSDDPDEIDLAAAEMRRRASSTSEVAAALERTAVRLRAERDAPPGTQGRLGLR